VLRISTLSDLYLLFKCFANNIRSRAHWDIVCGCVYLAVYSAVFVAGESKFSLFCQ